MLVKSDAEKEKKIVQEVLSKDENLKQQHDLFVAEMALKQKLINALKPSSIKKNC